MQALRLTETADKKTVLFVLVISVLPHKRRSAIYHLQHPGVNKCQLEGVSPLARAACQKPASSGKRNEIVGSDKIMQANLKKRLSQANGIK